MTAIDRVRRMPCMVPWASARINTAEVRRRLEMQLYFIEMMEMRRIVVARRWTVRAHSAQAMLQDAQLLEPRKCYMVAAYRAASMTSITAVEANVMRFITHVRVSPERAAVVDEWLAAKRVAHNAKNAALEEDRDEAEGWWAPDDADCDADLRMAATLLHVFECLETGRRYTIDVYGWGIDRHDGVHIAVVDVTSSAWKTRSGPFDLGLVADFRRAEKRMASIRRGWERQVAADVAATAIQRAWRRARADPAHPICRKRLRAEFEALA